MKQIEIRDKIILILNIILISAFAAAFLLTKMPAEVSGLSVAETTYDSAKLSWNDSDDSQGYLVFRSEDGKTFDCIGETEETVFTDTDLVTGRTYSYNVAAFNGIRIREADRKSAVKAEPELDTPKVAASVKDGVISLKLNDVEGATGYVIYRDNKKIAEQSEKTFTDKNASADETHRYTAKAYREQENVPVIQDEATPENAALINEPSAPVPTESLTAYSNVSKPAKIKLVSVGDMSAEVMGQDILFSWEPNEKYTLYKIYEGKDLLAETSECEYRLEGFDPSSIYNMKLVGYTGDEKTRSPEKIQKFEIGSEEMTNEDAIDAACEWGVQIAEDDSFNYGECPRALHNGCYFCKTNGKKGKGYEKTYICNALVHACYAHGAEDPAMLKACRHGHSIGMTEESFTKYGKWKKAGKPSKEKLKKGDVLVANKSIGESEFHHVALYLGDGKILEATRKGWSDKSIAIRPLAAKYYDRFDFVMRYTGHGGGEKYIVKEVKE